MMARRAAPALVALASCALRAGALQTPPARAGPAAAVPRENAGTPSEATVMALAAYARSPDVAQFPELSLAFVNSLRGVGFSGKIIVGMWENTTDRTGYMRRAAVTPKYIRQAPCQLRYSEDAVGKINPNYVTRNVCTEDFPHLKLDNARWVYGLRWLEECSTCSDWVMYADFGDINFQLNPLDLLPRVDSVAPETVYLTEEMRPRVDDLGRVRGVSTSNWLVQPGVMKCFGRWPGLDIGRKPMLNIASSFGTRAGMLRWLGRLAEEFENISHRVECDPVVICDQGVLNHLFYNERAMPYATPKKYGQWIVNTMGMPCSNARGYQPGSSMGDLTIIDSAGLVWNEDGTLPAVIHQGKVCWENYIVPYVYYNFTGTHNSSTYAATISARNRNAAFPGRRVSTSAIRHTLPHHLSVDDDDGGGRSHQTGGRTLPRSHQTGGRMPPSAGRPRAAAPSVPPGWTPMAR